MSESPSVPYMSQQIRHDFCWLNCKGRVTSTLFALFLSAQLALLPLNAAELVDGTETAIHPSATEVDAAIEEVAITEDDREHWALLPLTRPEVPAFKVAKGNEDRVESENAGAFQNAIDLFIAAELESSGLEQAPEASRRSLYRRLKFDLHGVPPNSKEVDAFRASTDPLAVEHLVDELLADKQYGERWAQHWLDLARFAETDGFEHDKIRKQAWRYRDWVIDALNNDLPYDDFIRAQLAGDLVDQEVATMFVMCGPDMPDINEQDLRRHDKLNELTGTIGSAVLGLQFQCAQCHDHKYDPISQADFYRLRAVFEPAIPKFVRDRHVLTLKNQANPEPARFYRRGELKNKGATVPPGVPRWALAAGEPHELSPNNPREQFCNWLFDPQNPLTARVIANRVWQHHFGRSLTENPSDFGVVAGEPSHPKLLDWLACELIDHNWSLKHLHRLILTSATYRQSGKQECDDIAIRTGVDPDGDRYSYFPGFRLDGESIRDAMLSVSGLRNDTMHGPGVYPPLPPELRSTLLKNQWSESKDAAQHYRRSIYTFARRNLRYPIFDAFDRPDAGSTCAVRNRSTTAVQSLYMLNSPFTLRCAEHLVENALATHSKTGALNDFPNKRSTAASSPQEFLFEKILGRPASNVELLWLKDLTDASSPKREQLCTLAVALFNCNEFIYVD